VVRTNWMGGVGDRRSLRESDCSTDY